MRSGRLRGLLRHLYHGASCGRPGALHSLLDGVPAVPGVHVEKGFRRRYGAGLAGGLRRAGAGWGVGAAASGVLGCAGAGYLVRLAGIRRPDWYLEPLLAAILAAPGAVALLSVVPVFV